LAKRGNKHNVGVAFNNARKKDYNIVFHSRRTGLKILYAVQGTGNGHISRSRDVIAELRKSAEVDLLVSERQHEINLGFEVKYSLRGLGFVFGRNGGIDYYASLKKARFDKLLGDINDLPVTDYDMVVSDFEPISSWACRLKKKPCVSLSHQTSFVSPKSPRPEKHNKIMEFIIKWYAPVCIPLGLHFREYDNFIKTPIIRKELRNYDVRQNGHYTVYLPSFYEQNLIRHLKKIDVRWELFSKHHKGEPYTEGNVSVYPVSYERFIESLTGSEGILANAGFETPSEALFLGKKLLAIPMKGQYEQECNAAALEQMGFEVTHKVEKDFDKTLEKWVNLPPAKPESYGDVVPEISETILALAERYGDQEEFRHPVGSPIEDAEKKGLLDLFV